MTMCDSDRGEWGRACPDCGAVLPARQAPLASWMAGRPGEWVSKTTDRVWSPASRAKREATFARKRIIATEREREVARIVEKHGGNRKAAARELGVSAPTVMAALARLRAKGYAVPSAIAEQR